MQEVVEFLSKKEKETDRDFNVVLGPGLEALRIPALELRNVTTTEVLSVCATLLDLKVVPVPGDGGGRTAAWLVTPRAPLAAAAAANPGAPADSAGAAPVVTLAASARPAAQSRVFGIASLLPKPAATDESMKARALRLDSLLNQLVRFAREQDPSSELRAYPELDIIVVKSTAMPLMEQAIEAMSKDAGSKALEEAEARVAREAERANEQNAMLGEANAALRALQLESEARERDVAQMQQRMEAMQKELETLRAAAAQRR